MDQLILHKDLDRRIFIKGVGLVSAGLLVQTMLGGCECLLAEIKNRPIRRRIRTGSAEVDADIATYQDAVRLMMALPASDPRSWVAQAAIHGTALGGFNRCQHGTPHFFSWHRAFLLYFERICRKLTGNSKFGLPYWNWNQDPVLHAAFTDPTSPLFHARTRTSVAGFSAVSAAELDPIFADTNFYTFGSQIEGTPHNNVHVIIGGDMGTGGSASDPIFWAHHCMVDYCWAKWNIELGNDNTNDPTWTGTSWSDFVDENGSPVSVTAGITTLMPLLSYQYESSVIGGLAAAEMARADFETIKKRIEKGADIRLDVRRRIPVADVADIAVERPFSKETQASVADLSTLLEGNTATDHVFASIDFAELPPTGDFFVRTFVNLPTAGAATPVTDHHFAGTFAFFGTHQENAQGHHHTPHFLVNVTNALRELRRRHELSDGTPISVQLVAVPISGQFENKAATLRLQKIELLVSPIVVHGK